MPDDRWDGTATKLMAHVRIRWLQRPFLVANGVYSCCKSYVSLWMLKHSACGTLDAANGKKSTSPLTPKETAHFYLSANLFPFQIRSLPCDSVLSGQAALHR